MRRRKGDERALTSVVEDLVEDGSIADPRARVDGSWRPLRIFREKGYDRTTVRDLTAPWGFNRLALSSLQNERGYPYRGDGGDHCRQHRASSPGVNPESPPRERLVQLIHCELQGILGETSDALAVLCMSGSVSQVRRVIR